MLLIFGSNSIRINDPASIYLIQSIVTNLIYKVIIFQVIRCIPLAPCNEFLYILYICKWPPVNTEYYFVAKLLYREPAHICCTNHRKSKSFVCGEKNCSYFPKVWSLPLSLISMVFFWFSTNKGLYLRTDSFALVNIPYHCSYVPKIRTSVKKGFFILLLIKSTWNLLPF